MTKEDTEKKQFFKNFLRIRFDPREIMPTDYFDISTIFHGNGQTWLKISTSILMQPKEMATYNA